MMSVKLSSNCYMPQTI